ncbi:pheST operon leader peptide PheM [Citrobacter amalonaticus]|nr:pheST operon leader peptide PheM [Citrobacter amalonaticus]
MLLFSASFFTLAPDSGRLARERRNERQRKKPPDGGFFCARNREITFNEPVSSPTQ